jgi:hypothetical protein
MFALVCLGVPWCAVSGLELYTEVLNRQEQERLVKYIRDLEVKGNARQLCGKTFTAPRKWMKGKGRVTMQFGCVYNYATDKQASLYLSPIS